MSHDCSASCCEDDARSERKRKWCGYSTGHKCGWQCEKHLPEAPPPREPEFDWKVLQVDRCSYRVMQEILYAILNTGAEVHDSYVNNAREMLIKPDWTSAEILLKVPRKLKGHQSNVHTSNLDFFTKIKGVKVKDRVRNFMANTKPTFAESADE